MLVQCLCQCGIRLIKHEEAIEAPSYRHTVAFASWRDHTRFIHWRHHPPQSGKEPGNRFSFLQNSVAGARRSPTTAAMCIIQ
jgi:hypothetical protein